MHQGILQQVAEYFMKMSGFHGATKKPILQLCFKNAPLFFKQGK